MTHTYGRHNGVMITDLDSGIFYWSGLRSFLCLYCASVLRINLRLISAHTSAQFTAWLMREVNCCFLVTEHSDLSIFSLFLSLVNATFLYSEYKQISIAVKQVIDRNVNFATTREDKLIILLS